MTLMSAMSVSVITFRLWRRHGGRRWWIFRPPPQQGGGDAVFHEGRFWHLRKLTKNENIGKGREKHCDNDDESNSGSARCDDGKK